MPRISVIIAAYNLGKAIVRCLESVKVQTMGDFEAIVVDDCSTDDTSDLIGATVGGDPRFTVIRHDENKGLHLARLTGVRAATAPYAFFLDGDDEIAPDMLEELDDFVSRRPADIVHFGITVVAEGGLSEDARASFESYVNRPSRPLEGEAILRTVYDKGEGQLMDWRATQRLYRTRLLKRAFSLMRDTRLERAEDGYECFVISALAANQEPLETCRGLVYHYGGGVTGTSRIDADTFGTFCEQFKECVVATEEFVAAHPSHLRSTCLMGMTHKMLELLSNDWLVRVADVDKPEAAKRFEQVWGAAVAGRELYRFVRDRAYSYVGTGTTPQGDAELDVLVDVARSVTVDDADTSREAERYRRMRGVAEGHLSYLSQAQEFRSQAERQDIRIFVTSHKRVDVPDSSMLQLVQVGPGNKRDRFAAAFHDDEGDNISDRNPMYCEMTTQYWAWKNVSCDYVGFCHYRRYFNFTDTTYQENDFGEVMDDFIDAEACERYGLDDESIRRCVEGYDVVTTGFHALEDFPGDFKTPREHYARAPYLHIADLERMATITKRLYPDYADDVDGFLDGPISCFCNMYIMRKELFDAYCAWMFPILQAFVDETDMSHYSKEALRTPGHLTERLFNIYYLHAMRTDAGWKTKQLQCVHFQNPDVAYELPPITTVRHGLDPQSVIPVVLASDDGYVPMLTATILSMVENASPDRFYDVVVFEKNISMQHRKAMLELFAPYKNVSVRFHNVWRLIQGYDLSTNNEHISMETYYRFLIQEVLSYYDKVLYLDSDLIVQGDVAELFDIELGDNLIAGASDIDFLGNLNMNDGKRMAYARDVLGLADPYAYFQAGVLVLNTAELRRLHSVADWMRIVSEVDYIYDDQDILNAECQGRVVQLPFDWNVMHDCAGRVANVFSFAPNATFDAYQASRANPKIIHYAGFEKPWYNPDCDYAGIYWSYARRTPFYEMLLGRLSTNMANLAMGKVIQDAPPVMPQHEKAVSEGSPLRRLIDPIAPYGTARREVLKSIGRFVQGKK